MSTPPDPLPAWGRVRRHHVSLRKGSSGLTAEASDPHKGPIPPTSVRTSHAIEPTYHPRGPEPPRAPQARTQARARVFHWKARPPTAFNAGGSEVLCRHGTRGSLCQASPCSAYYQGTQCSRLCRTRAEPLCRINWIRRHGTFPSCWLRRKLHGPFSCVASDAASYAWRRSDKTAPGYAERGIQGAGKEIQE